MATTSSTRRTATATTGKSEATGADADARLERLRTSLIARIRHVPSLVVAYSGGVDSAYLAVAATDVLGDRVLCVTADSASYPERHRSMAIDIARRFELRHEIIATGELERPEYRANAPDRCYYCKHELYTHLAGLAAARGFAAVADGSNADDRGDYRPGRKAAREFGVISPLDDAGLTKGDIRALSQARGLPIWDEPASACLSSRIPYYSEVSVEKLRMIEAAEEALRQEGFRVLRVRHHGDVARIEVGRDELPRLVEADMSARVDARVRAIGFKYVTVDLRGYRLGSLNEGLRLEVVY